MRFIRVTLMSLMVSLFWYAAVPDSRAQWSFDFAEAENNLLFGQYGHLGRHGFFGAFDIDASTTGDFAPLNGWLGNRDGDIGQIASGTNASLSSVTLAAQPRLGNDWVTIAGRYTIQSYQTSGSQGSYVAMSPGQLTLWAMAVNTPLGRISWGKQEFVRGFGLQFAASRTEEYLALESQFEVPNILWSMVCAGMLPRSVLSWFNPDTWPRYYQEDVSDEIELDYSPDGIVRWLLKPVEKPLVTGSYAGSEIGPAGLLIGIATYPWQTIELPGDLPVAGFNAWNNNDLNASRVQNYAVYFLYNTTDLTFGGGGTRVTFHAGPELQQSSAARVTAPTIEQYLTEGWVFLRYNNGCVFLKTELDWYNRLIRYQRSEDGTFFGIPDNIDGSGSLFAPDYRESWRYMVEVGALKGPVSVKALYAFIPGPDRRHGILIDRQPFVQDTIRAAFGVFEPYSILLNYYYGGGVDAPAHISDAAVYAAKVDYALAANLFIEGSILKAYRTSHGYGWGFVRPSLTTFGEVDYGIRGTYLAPSPAIPDNDLGWECTAGVTWKLLEGFVVGARVAYWTPGRWFTYACIDRSVPNWDTPGPGNNWGINPDRTIDPVIGTEFRLSATF